MSFKKFTGYDEIALLSPDASMVAYGTQSSDRKVTVTHSGALANGVPGHLGGSEIEVTSLENNQIRLLTPGWGSSWGPRWSTDGRYLAFFSDRNGIPQIWLWDHKANSFSCVCEDPICVWMGFERVFWLPGNTKCIAKLRAPGWNPPADEETPQLGSRDVWVSPRTETPRSKNGENWRPHDLNRGDIAVIDILTGKAERIGMEIFPFGLAVSPDGKYAAAMCFSGLVEKSSKGILAYFDLHLLAVDGSRSDILVRNIPQRQGTAFSWSPGSDALAYTTQDENEGKLILVTIEGIQRRLGEEGNIDFHNPYHRPPLWSPDGKTIYCCHGSVYAVSTITGKAQNLTTGLNRTVCGIFHSFGSGVPADFGRPGTLVVMAVNTATMQNSVFRIDAEGFTALTPEENRSRLYSLLYGDTQGTWIVGQIEDAANPPDLFALEITTLKEKHLTRLNPGIATVKQGPIKLISFPGPNGKKLQSALLLPPDYESGKQYPTVIEVYYGSYQSGLLNTFGKTYSSWLTTHGYAVLLPDLPFGGPNPAEAITDLLLRVMDAAIDQGYTDPDRVGILGGSQGGYNVCCVVTRMDRFRAAVAIAPFTDLVTQSLTIKGNQPAGAYLVEGGNLRLGVTLWEDRQRYIDNSPILYPDGVKTPILFLHGTADPACPIAQSEGMYTGLLRLGKTATLVRYHGEGHSPHEWSNENYQDFRTRIKEWFNLYLK
jgi:dipeptidyl aminopeptidase/acylaminoacyl peptidase